MYVAIEGIDTAGKSTQIALLKESYPDAIFTLEPGGSALGVELRHILLQANRPLSPKAEFLLFLADRAQHIQEVVLPNLDKMVVSDRSLISGVAYAQKVGLEDAVALNRFATSDILPHFAIILKIPKETLIQRLNAKKRDHIEERGVEHLLEIQERLIFACEALGVPFVCIDASLRPDEIFEEIKQNITSKIFG
ncbi:dTMP kinase [Helicobacter enhydrae]|uniref:Thymidylate kinase n=1 Tax=Helicobacter enhydrae TaxID=222136 RepID=A0A1B1U6Y2_9HELI|nr:dTMP kinase [Helicobacter enhydrae]ANV98500.1 dTMP kinase [Helicobacter enhydrae]